MFHKKKKMHKKLKSKQPRGEGKQKGVSPGVGHWGIRKKDCPRVSRYNFAKEKARDVIRPLFKVRERGDWKKMPLFLG